MAAVYNAEGIFMYDDGQPSIDQMQYELARNGKSSPLDSAVNAIKNVAINNNPLMLRKQGLDLAGDIPRVMASGVAPFIAGITQPVIGVYQYASKMPGVLYRENVLGDPQSMQEAATIREGLPQFAPPGARYNPEPMNQRIEAIGQAVAPQTPQGQAVLEGVAQVFEPLKLPMMGPGSGLPGTSRISPRPMFTPNDLRVVGAEATRVGRQIGDIPTDFVNAQSGLQRIDPVTGQPVLGARIQSGVGRLGDIMEQRKMQGLTPIPGLPAALQPETSMYAVRPQGSRLTTPVVPETARGYSPPVDPANDMFKEVVGLDPERAEATPTLLHSLNSRVQFNDVPNDRDAINGFRSFMQNKAQEMYPEAETPRQALEIFNAMHYDTPSRHAVENKMFDEFIQTPEGQQLLPNAVSSDEMAKRHDAATEGLKNMWGKYLVKNLGTEGNPLVKIAAEKGLTQLPAEDVIRVANEEAYAASANRQKAGMPIQGSFAQPIADLKQEIEAISLPLQNAANAEQSLGQAAHIAGVDPASVPEYLEARKNAAKLNKQKNELQKKLDNLTLASAYEALEDAAVKPMPAETLLKEMQPSERPFYPGLKESAARGETSYKSAIGAIENTGFIQAAEKFYNDVLQGKIPADKAATYPVDKYIRENAEARIKIEQAEKAKLEGHKTAVVQSLKDSANALPADKKFGNVGVVELTKDTPLDVANKEVAASTEVLDICIGEGGSGKGTKNLFTGKKDPRYTPIVNLLTGEPNPNATRNTSGYVTELQRGEQLPMFRDMETGLPIAALQFHTASSIGANGQPMFNIGYASGAGNGRIEAKYVNGVRDYLNSRADDIAGIGNNLEDNTGIYDTKNKPSLAKARRYAQVSENEMKTVDWNSMPRFMTAEDVKQAVKGNVPAVAPQQSPAFQEDVARLQATLIDNIDTVVDDAVNHSNLDVPEDLDNRLHAVFARMRQEYFPTFADDPIPTMNRALDFLRDQIDRRANNASDISQEMVDALDNYAAELEAARDELLAQQQRAVQPAPQAPPTDAATVINNVLETAARELGADVYNRAQDLLNLIGNTYSLTDQPEQFRNAVRGYASPDAIPQQTELVRRVMETLADRLDQQAPQMQPAEQLRQAMAPRLFAGNARVVNEALQEYSSRLQDYAANQLQNGMSPVEIADNVRSKVNEYRNMVLRGPTINTQNFTPDELSEYVSELRQMIDNTGRWIEGQQQQAIAPQTANLPAEVQQNIDRRNQHITNAYQTALTPNTGDASVDTALSEFSDLLDGMATNMFGNGYNASEIAENLADRVHAEHMALATPDRIDARGLTPFEADMIRSRLNDAYGNLRTIHEMGVPAPEPMVELDFEPDTMHGANEPYTMQSAVDMARDLFEQERMDANNFDIPSIQDSIHALQAGVFDDERIRQLPEQQRQSFAEDVAFRLQNMLDDIRGRQVQPVPAQPATAPYRPMPAIIHAMSDQAITADMTPEEINRVQNMFESLTDVNSPEELQNIVGLARSYAMGGWDDFSDVQREWLARNIEEYIQDNTSPPEEAPATDNVFGATGQALRITDRDRELYTELNDMLDNAIEEGYPLPDLGDNESVARLILNDEVGGDINNATDAERRRLADLVRQYGAHGTLPRGHKKGGRIRKYQDGGSVKGDVAFGVYPGMGKRSKKSDVGDKLNAALIPQDAFDLATTIAPFGKVGKVLAAGILAGDPAEAHAGNMTSLLKLVAREAPEQFQSIRNALYRTFHTGLEHSVVGSTRMGGPSEVMQGTTSGVIPNRLDIKAARKNIDQSPLIDFHTHPSQNTSVSDFMVRPSDTDLKYWMGQYGSSYMPQWSNEARVMVGTPANKGERTTGAYNFFATDKPAQTLNPATYEAAKYELQRSKPLQSIKDNPLVGEYLDAGGDIGDLLDSASPLLLQKYFAEKGLGRHEMQLSNRPVTSPSVTEQELFNQIANPAMEVLGSKRFESFAEGGTVHKNPSVEQMKYELMKRS